MVPEGIDLRTKGDHWDAWDEQLSPEWDIMHICIDTTTPMTILNLLASRFSTFFYPRFDGPLMVVTNSDDYEEEFVEFRYPNE